MSTCEATWWLAGGWAVDSLIGDTTRPHSDIDVLILRDQQHLVRDHLKSWDLHAADPSGVGRLDPWPPGQTLPREVHDIWCRPEPDSPWALQFMIDDRAEDEWIFRRDARIRRPVTELTGRASREGLRVLTIEVQLLYKSGTPRPKDEQDFTAVLPLLTPAELGWLDGALSAIRPGHPWRARLTA